MIFRDPVPAMVRGVLKAVHVVMVTYGAKGRHVLTSRPRGQIHTMDGASVLWEIRFEDPVEQMGLRLLQDACHQVSQSVGDGTSTTAVLVGALLEGGWRAILAGRHPNDIQVSWTAWAQDLVVDDVLEVTPCSTLEDLTSHLDTVLHRDPPAAEVVARALWEAGTQGAIDVSMGHGRCVVFERRRGYHLDRGGVESQESLGLDAARVLETPLVALVDGILTKLEHVQPLLEEATAFPHPLAVVSRGCFGEALKTIITNDRRLQNSQGRPVEWMAIKVGSAHPREALEDLASLSGATILDPTWGYAFKPEWFGSMQRVQASRSRSSWTAYADESTLQRIETAVLALDKQGGSSGDLDRLQRRKAMLSDGYVDIRVGGDTEAVQKERMSRIEDAVCAGRAALVGGMIRDTPYLSLGEVAPDAVVQRALQKPHALGGDQGIPALVVEKVVKTSVSTAAMILGCARAITRPCKKTS